MKVFFIIVMLLFPIGLITDVGGLTSEIQFHPKFIYDAESTRVNSQITKLDVINWDSIKNYDMIQLCKQEESMKSMILEIKKLNIYMDVINADCEQNKNNRKYFATTAILTSEISRIYQNIENKD